MTPEGILSLCARHGITLEVVNGALRYHAPKGALTEELRALIVGSRNALIAHLAADGPAPGAALSYNQQFLWFLHRMDPESASYNVAFSARIVSAVNAEKIQTAFQKLLDRHALLRTTYHAGSDGPCMRIHPGQKLAWERTDAAGWTDEELDRRVERAYRRPFDLVNGPVLRVDLFSRAPQDHVLLLTIHHIACDGWALGTLVKEWRKLSSGEDIDDLPAGDYVDFVGRQRAMLAGAEGERLSAFWKHQLRGELPEAGLPLDRPRPRVRSSRGRTHHFAVTGHAYASVIALARTGRTTLYTVLLAAFQALLARYTSQDDVVIGTPVSVRPRKQDEGTVGCFINPVVIRQSIPADLTFQELLARTRTTVLEAIEHRQYPFPLLVEQLCPVRDPGRSPIFQVMFNFLSRQTLGDVADLVYRDKESALSGESLAFGDLVLRPFPLDQEEGQVDLALEMIDDGRGLTGVVKYSTDIFEDRTVARLAGHFQVLLQGIVADPGQRLWELPLLDADERHQALRAWNETAAAYSAEACLDELFVRQARSTPGSVAVEFKGSSLTYEALELRSRTLSEHLRRLGVGPDMPVALYIEPSLEMAVALLGIMRAGGAYLPLDRKFPRERLAVMLEDAQPRVLVTLARLRDEAPVSNAQVVCVDDPSLSTGAPPAPVPRTSRDLAYVLFTSGSTGRPKGVQIPHRAVVNFLESMRREPGISPQDTLLSVTTISFDILGLELWLPLTSGAKVVLAPPEAVSDAKQLAGLIEASGATIMQATPATWRLLLDGGWSGSPRLAVLCGGESWPRELAAALLPRCASLWNMYGPTETTIWSAVQRVRSGEPVRIGRPIANTTFYVVDRKLQPVPAGVPGELLIGGAGLARGYLNRPDLTAGKFIPDPFDAGPDARLYRTGDLVRRLPDGTLEFLDRLDQQVKIRGFRIEPGDIESVAAGFTGIRQAVVVVRADEGDKQLVAYLVPEKGASPPVGPLRQYMREKLPGYMVPEIFVMLERLPLTPNGKVDRKALPRPVPVLSDQGSPDAAPRSGLEGAIAAAWQTALHLGRVGRNDNFFDLGGNSLRLAQVHGMLRPVKDDLSMLDLFTYPTISALAAFMRGGEQDPAPAGPMDDRVETLKQGRARLHQRRERSIHERIVN